MGLAEAMEKPNFKLNCLELVLGVASVVLILIGYPILKLGTLMGTLYGLQVVFMFVNLMIVVGHLADFSMHKNLLLTLSIVGSIVWLSTGAFFSFMFLMTVVYVPIFTFLLSGFAALANALVHMLDAIRRCRVKSTEGVVYRKPGDDCLVPIDEASGVSKVPGVDCEVKNGE